MAYQLTKSKKKHPPTVYIDTQLLQPGGQVREETRIREEVGDVRRENRQIEQVMKQLAKMNEQNRLELQRVTKLLEKEEARYNQSDSSDEEEPHHHHPDPKRQKKRKKYSVISGGGKSMA